MSKTYEILQNNLIKESLEKHVPKKINAEIPLTIELGTLIKNKIQMELERLGDNGKRSNF